jgi:hypothetical protein
MLKAAGISFLIDSGNPTLIRSSEDEDARIEGQGAELALPTLTDPHPDPAVTFYGLQSTLTWRASWSNELAYGKSTNT